MPTTLAYHVKQLYLRLLDYSTETFYTSKDMQTSVLKDDMKSENVISQGNS